VAHHARGLTELLEAQGLSESDAEKQVRAIAGDFHSANLNDRETAILFYAKMLTERPHSVSNCEIQSLRRNGLNDLAIHDLASIVGYFAFVNRIANGLGVELEDA